MTYFTSDNHFGHDNVIKFQNRPFSSVEEMDVVMLQNWNAKVKKNDTVYVLGDLIFRSKEPAKILERLNGKKHLVVGNHDGSWMTVVDANDYFLSVSKYLETSDGVRGLVMSHYPMLLWPHMRRTFMVHGHIHDDTSYAFWSTIASNERILNAGADINGYEPVTFEELVENNRRFKAEHPTSSPHAHPRVKD